MAPLACSKSEPPASTPVRTSTPIAAAVTPTVAPEVASAPTIQGSPGAIDLNDFSSTADFEWNLAEEAEDAEFEIDADATSFYMPQDNVVTFKAKALNGTPPFKFVWDFGDGSPPGEGEMIKHRFTKLGRATTSVTGTDASGATSLVNLNLRIDHPVNFAIRMQWEQSKIDDLRARYGEPPEPAPTATP